MTYQYRFIKIDAAPYKNANEVDKLVGSMVTNFTETSLEFRSGELDDWEFAGHRSYFVGVRFNAADETAAGTASEKVNELRAECTKQKLPVIEIDAKSPGYSNLTRSMFGRKK